MQPQGSHTKPPIRRPLNGRVVVSDDEDDAGRAPAPPATSSTSASRPAPIPPAARDAVRASDSGGPRRAGGPGQPRNKSLSDAIKNHLQPPPRTVPAKRKEPAGSNAPSSARAAGSEDARNAVADEEHRAAKRVRHSPPEPTLDRPAKREERPGSLPPSTLPPPPPPLPAPKPAATAGPSFLQVAAPDAPKDDDRPPPPPPLEPFIKRTKVSPTPPLDPMPAGGPSKRKRALSFSPEGDAVAVHKDQAKAAAHSEDKPPPAPKKKLKPLQAIIDESNDRAKAGSSTPPAHPALSAVQASSTSRPVTPNGARQVTPLPAPRPVKEETPAPDRAQEPPARKSDGVRQQASAPPARARVRDADDLAKDKQHPRPAPKAPPPHLEKIKREAIEPSPAQSSRPRGSSISAEEKGKARPKPEASRSKPHTTVEEKQPAKKGKARAQPEPEVEQPALPKKKKPLPLSSILKESDERKQKEQAARIPTVSRTGEPLPSSSSSRAEPLHPERPAATTSTADHSHTPAASASRPPPADVAPAARKSKLLPLASIVKEAELRAAGPVQPPSRPVQAASAETSSSNRAEPSHTEPVTATHPADDLHTPPAPVQAPLPGPPVDESPRLVMAKKQASSELSIMNTALDSGQSQLKQPIHALDALLMLADTAAMAPIVPRPKPERLSSEPRRESSSDTTLSARERAQQQAQSELSHMQDHPDLPKRKTPRRKLSEILEDEHDFDTKDNASCENNTKQDEAAPASSHAMSSPPSLGLLGLGAYGSSPEPEDADEAPQAPVDLASPPAAIVQSRAPDTPKQSSPSAAVQSEAPSTDLPLKTNRAVLDPGSPPSRSILHDSHRAPSPAPSRPRPPRPRAEHRRVSSRMVVQSPESGAEESSSPLSPPAQPATPEPQPPSSPAWPADPPQEEAPAPEPAAQEAPAPAPARKKLAGMSFKKKKQPSFDEPEPTPPSQARAPEREKTPPPKRLPASLPPKPLAAGLPAKPPAATAAAPTPYGRQLPPEHSSRDVDPTSVLSSLLGKPKRDSGITPEQRREWDARKEADRLAREAEYAAQGPPLRMQRQMQTILQWESKFKAKRTNVSPNIVAAAFKQRWERQHGQWTGAPSRRPHQQNGPPSGSQGRPLPPTPAPAANDRANANSSNSSQSSQTRSGWHPVANGHSVR